MTLAFARASRSSDNQCEKTSDCRIWYTNKMYPFGYSLSTAAGDLLRPNDEAERAEGPLQDTAAHRSRPSLQRVVRWPHRIQRVAKYDAAPRDTSPPRRNATPRLLCLRRAMPAVLARRSRSSRVCSSWSKPRQIDHAVNVASARTHHMTQDRLTRPVAPPASLKTIRSTAVT
jgi:hypothetical protein